jgi:hypothetical protein
MFILPISAGLTSFALSRSKPHLNLHGMEKNKVTVRASGLTIF